MASGGPLEACTISNDLQPVRGPKNGPGAQETRAMAEPRARPSWAERTAKRKTRFKALFEPVARFYLCPGILFAFHYSNALEGFISPNRGIYAQHFNFAKFWRASSRSESRPNQPRAQPSRAGPIWAQAASCYTTENRHGSAAHPAPGPPGGSSRAAFPAEKNLPEKFFQAKSVSKVESRKRVESRKSIRSRGRSESGRVGVAPRPGVVPVRGESRGSLQKSDHSPESLLSGSRYRLVISSAL